MMKDLIWLFLFVHKQFRNNRNNWKLLQSFFGNTSWLVLSIRKIISFVLVQTMAFTKQLKLKLNNLHQ